MQPPWYARARGCGSPCGVEAGDAEAERAHKHIVVVPHAEGNDRVVHRGDPHRFGTTDSTMVHVKELLRRREEETVRLEYIWRASAVVGGYFKRSKMSHGCEMRRTMGGRKAGA